MNILIMQILASKKTKRKLNADELASAKAY